ncbi:hypothetical protein Veis_4841 [Verminephrobacter eiseniae EF01-2]|uniref:Uncharacterized protein n=2 Tax=Verminephrobacter eiseniae TaxID=364317 RepID=A1WSC5_VEREI|nr:hypothetical protein Veis_4841 [Verminephrobacter eiseniae EF01-2]
MPRCPQSTGPGTDRCGSQQMVRPCPCVAWTVRCGRLPQRPVHTHPMPILGRLAPGVAGEIPHGIGHPGLGGDESRASTEGATDKPANDGALHASDPANDDLAAQFPLTDGGILDIAEILARLGNAIHGSKSANGTTGNGTRRSGGA